MRAWKSLFYAKKLTEKLFDYTNNESNSPSTKHNKLQSKGIIKVCKALKRCKSLLRFSIENNNIDDEAADDIATVLFDNNEIEQVWIGSNCFSEYGIVKIVKPLEMISTLKVFDFSHTTLSKETVCSIEKVFKKSKKIEQLWLENSTIPPDGLERILFSLKKCLNLNVISLRGIVSNGKELAFPVLSAILFICNSTNIEHIYLGNNAIHDKGTSQLIRALKDVRHFHTLDLYNTNITEASVDSIVEVITSNSQLQQLFLGDNKLYSSGAIKIVTALRGSHNIQVLGLSHNHITSEAAGEISTAVSTMPYLSTLMLDGNELEVYGVCTIIEGVQHLNWLMILSLTDNVNNDQEEEDVRRKFTNIKFKLYL